MSQSRLVCTLKYVSKSIDEVMRMALRWHAHQCFLNQPINNRERERTVDNGMKSNSYYEVDDER